MTLAIAASIDGLRTIMAISDSMRVMLHICSKQENAVFQARVDTCF